MSDLAKYLELIRDLSPLGRNILTYLVNNRQHLDNDEMLVRMAGDLAAMARQTVTIEIERDRRLREGPG